MKKDLFKLTKWMFLSLSIMFLVSCSKDDDDKDNDVSLVGTWNLESSTYDVKINDVDFITYFMDEFGMTNAQAQAQFDQNFKQETGSINIKEDGTYTATIGKEDSGTWILSENGNTLTIDGDEDPMVFEVKSLTESAIVLKMTRTQIQDFNSDDTPDIMVMISTMTLKR